MKSQLTLLLTLSIVSGIAFSSCKKKETPKPTQNQTPPPPAPEDWVQISSIAAQDIGIGENDEVWMIGGVPNGEGNFSIYNFNYQDQNWEDQSGKVRAIDAGANGNAWATTTNGQIWEFENNNWATRTGAGSDISVGSAGNVWVLGNTLTNSNYLVYKRVGGSFVQIPNAGALRIAADYSGNAWVINHNNTIYKYNGSAFELVPNGSATDIGIGSTNKVCVVGVDNKAYIYKDNVFVPLGTVENIKRISVGKNYAWAVGTQGQIYRIKL